MHPLVFGVPAFFVVLPAAVTCGLALSLWSARRRGMPIADFALVLGGALLAGLAGAKLYSLWERGGDVGTLMYESSAGFRYPGGVLALALSLPLLRRLLPATVRAADVADILAPGAGLAMAVVRTHCFLTGCCAGSVCHHAWCLVFPHDSPPFQQQMIHGLIPPSAAASLPVHPLQIYFAMASLAAGVVALAWRRRAAYAGQTAVVFLAVHETAKGLLELLRFPPAPLVRNASLAVAVAAWFFLAVRRARRRQAPSRRARAAVTG